MSKISIFKGSIAFVIALIVVSIFGSSMAGSAAFEGVAGKPTRTPKPTKTPFATLTFTPTSPIKTTTIVTDNATTILGGSVPVTFGGTIVFTANISSANGIPNGIVRWTLSHQAPQDQDYNAGSGIVGACQGDVPVVNGVATCSVTPGYYSSGPFVWAINATATFIPTAGSSFVGSSGSDSTSKITVGRLLPETNGAQFITSGPMTLQVEQSDALGRTLTTYWESTLDTFPLGGVVAQDTPGNLMLFAGCRADTPPGSYYLSAIAEFYPVAVCPKGVDQSTSFECQRTLLSISIKSEAMCATP